MTQRIFVVMILAGLAAGLAGCSHPRPQVADSRSALLRPLATSGSDNQKDTARSDHKIHGAVSVGTGFGSGGNYGLGPQSGLQSGLGTMTGTGTSGVGLTPEGW
ncbi:hypothetical protein [Gluconobacter aidae]|uniref:Lipoprotein n=1 Tax=Gluconobacter aidae TaxID=2662454 RepID=A0A7X1SSM8_9PROT|nr:hypothetical protein [Gluconobacter aidae]MQR99950.1 hypothetical protein [Gluconobacter aidae]